MIKRNYKKSIWFKNENLGNIEWNAFPVNDDS